MTQCPEVIQQATEGGFPWVILAVLIVVGVGAYVWKKGLLGTATEGRIKAIIAELEHKVEEWKAKLEAKAQAKATKPATELAPAPSAPATASSVAGKLQRIAENNALIGRGITKEQADAANARILAEP